MARPENGVEEKPQMRVLGRRMSLPRSRLARMGLGLGLIVGGVLGFLPILGFWMIPLGLAVLAWDVPAIDRRRRRLEARYRLWRLRRRQQDD
jgi:hypothetical protein